MKNYLDNNEYNYLEINQNTQLTKNIIEIKNQYNNLAVKNSRSFIIDIHSHSINNIDEYDLFCNLFTVLYSLNSGGNMIFKLNLPIVNKGLINLIYICYNYFEKLTIYKSPLDFIDNSFYLIGINYEPIEEGITNYILEFIEGKGSYKLFNYLDMYQDYYPKSFGIQFSKINNLLLEKIGNNLKKYIFYYDNIKYIDSNFKKTIPDYLKEKNLEWFMRYKLKKNKL